MIDGLKGGFSVSRISSVLGFRRNTYYSRKAGNRPEERDAAIAALLNATAGLFLAWGFWPAAVAVIFHYLRRQGHTFNHKLAHRIWVQEGLHLRIAPKRAKLHRQYQDLLAPDKVNQGWVMAAVELIFLATGSWSLRARRCASST